MCPIQHFFNACLVPKYCTLTNLHQLENTDFIIFEHEIWRKMANTHNNAQDQCPNFSQNIQN